MLCDRCGGETKRKNLISKRTGNPYVVFECLEGCKNPDNPRYAYSFFANQNGDSRPARNQQIQQRQPTQNEAVSVLCAINSKLGQILDLVKKQVNPVTEPSEEPPPDISREDENPF